jgi:glycosidase
MLGLYRSLLQLRRAEPALAIGSIELVDAAPDILAYVRSYGTRRLLIALNFSEDRRPLPFPAGNLLLSTIDLGEFDGTLRPNEGVIMELAG